MRDVDTGERELTGETQALHSRITKLEQVSHNLPGHKNVDEELDRAWREWKSTFDAIKDSIILTDGEFKIIQANLASSQLFGRPLDQVIGKTCWQLVHGTNEAPEGCPLKRAKDTKKHEEMEVYLPQKGIWAADSVDPVLDEQGRLTGVVHIIRDITDRKQAEELLRKGRDRAQKYLDVAGVMLVAVDAEQRVGLINKKGCEILGYSEEEVIAKNWFDNFLPKRIKEEVKGVFNKLLCGESDVPEYYENPVLTKDGAERLIAWHNTVLRDDKGKVIATLGSGEDITERKKAEEEIAKLAKLLSENPYPVLRIHRDGTVLYANKASEPLLKARGSGVGRPVPAEWHRLAKEVLASGRVTREEAEHDGHVFAFRAVPIAESDYVNFYGMDITEQKKMGHTLRESEEKYRVLIENSPNLVAIYQDDTLKYVNKMMCEKLGWTFQEMTSPSFNPVEKIIPQRFQSLVKENIAKKLRREDVSPYEVSIKTRDGSEIPVIVKGQGILYLGKPAYEIIHIDITERKRAEEALRETSQYLENLFNYANAPIIVWDPQFKITRFNHAFEALTGRSAHDVIGKPIKILFPTDKVENSMEFIREALEGKRWETIEINILHLDGAVRTVLWNSATLFDLDGKTPVTTIAQGQDITERKQAEQKLLEDRAQLKSLASQLTLAEEHERHRLANELHDRISQSLVISKIKLDALRKSGRSRKSDKVLEDVCNSIGQTIQDTRTLTFDLSSPVLYELGFEMAVSEWLTDRIQKKHGITVEFEDDGEPKPLDDDIRVLLFRDVRELLINVVKHASAHKVKVSISKVGSEIHISVEDDGWGFDTKKVAATAVRKGGFGLFSIRERLGQLGGHLEIESEPGCGTKATLIAPLKQEKVNRKGKK